MGRALQGLIEQVAGMPLGVLEYPDAGAGRHRPAERPRAGPGPGDRAGAAGAVPAGSADGLRHYSQEVLVEANKHQTVDARLVPKAPEVVLASADSPVLEREAPEPSAAIRRKPGLYVAAGGAALVVLGLVLGSSAKSVEAKLVDANRDGALDVTRREVTVPRRPPPRRTCCSAWGPARWPGARSGSSSASGRTPAPSARRASSGWTPWPSGSPERCLDPRRTARAVRAARRRVCDHHPPGCEVLLPVRRRLRRRWAAVPGGICCVAGEAGCGSGASGSGGESNCSNGVDDDGDGAADCADSAVPQPRLPAWLLQLHLRRVRRLRLSHLHSGGARDRCVVPGWRGQRLRRAGRLRGSNCLGVGSCATSSAGTEVCTDALDNDADGLIDCADSDCPLGAACKRRQGNAPGQCQADGTCF